MNTLGRYAGWVVAFLGIMIAALLGRQAQQLRDERDIALSKLAKKDQQIEKMLKAEKLAKEQAEAARESEDTEPEPAPIDAPLLDAQLEAGSAQAPSSALPTFFAALGEMMKGEKGAALAKSTSQTQARMQYGALFRELNLPPEVEGQAIDIVASALENDMRQGMDMLTGKTLDPEQVKKEHEAALKQVRDELGRVLSADELARYDEFQAELPRHSLEQQYEMQLTMFNSSLTQESRDLIVQTLSEETLSLIPDFGKPGSGAETNPALMFEAQLTAIDRARERLVGELDEAQYAQAERFFEHQQQQAQVFREFMGSLMSAPKPQ